MENVILRCPRERQVKLHAVRPVVDVAGFKRLLGRLTDRIGNSKRGVGPRALSRREPGRRKTTAPAKRPRPGRSPAVRRDVTRDGGGVSSGIPWTFERPMAGPDKPVPWPRLSVQRIGEGRSAEIGSEDHSRDGSATRLPSWSGGPRRPGTVVGRPRWARICRTTPWRSMCTPRRRQARGWCLS